MLGPHEAGQISSYQISVDGIEPIDETSKKKINCQIAEPDLPKSWIEKFPTGLELAEAAANGHPNLKKRLADIRLMRRRECEMQIFESLERAVIWPRIQRGFTKVEDFLKFAKSVSQRRNTRGGNSLELHMRIILGEEGLKEGSGFSHRKESEKGRIPDFLFPSHSAYHDPKFPASQLRMLAAKSTCRERWPQVTKEADRIPRKHLLTLQKGLSQSQFDQMHLAGISLVVPKELHNAYPPAVRPRLITVTQFIGEVRALPS